MKKLLFYIIRLVSPTQQLYDGLCFYIGKHNMNLIIFPYTSLLSSVSSSLTRQQVRFGYISFYSSYFFCPPMSRHCWHFLRLVKHSTPLLALYIKRTVAKQYSSDDPVTNSERLGMSWCWEKEETTGAKWLPGDFTEKFPSFSFISASYTLQRHPFPW